MFRSLCTGLVAIVVAGFPVGVAHAQTADEVVARNLKARGGVEKLKSLNSAKITADVVQQNAKIHVVTYAKRPNLTRREMTATLAPGAAGRSGTPGTVNAVVGFDGETVWTMDPSTGNEPRAMTGPQADMAKQDADFDSALLDYKAKGHSVDLLGTEEINGRPNYHLKVTKKIGLVQHYYLDVETGLETRISSTIEQGGRKSELTTELSNYQTSEGLTMPFSQTQSVNGNKVAEVTIAKWELNVPIDDELFRMPGKK